MGSHRVLALVLLIVAPRAAAADGRAMYLRHCAPCHGASGDGEGPMARYLVVRPRDLTRGVFRFRSVPSGAAALDADLERTVRRGVPGTPMPSWDRVLGDRQIREVIAFVRTLAPAVPAKASPLPIPAPPSENAAAIVRGRSVYLLMQCWQCHGLGGRGDGQAVATLKDDRGAPIRALDFTRGFLKGGGAPEDVYRTLLTGLDGAPMPSYRESLVLVRDAFGDLAPLAAVLGPEQVATLRGYIATLPSGDAWGVLDPEHQARLSEGWRWDLVAYIRSLGRGSVLGRYFLDDPYLTR